VNGLRDFLQLSTHDRHALRFAYAEFGVLEIVFLLTAIGFAHEEPHTIGDVPRFGVALPACAFDDDGLGGELHLDDVSGRNRQRVRRHRSLRCGRNERPARSPVKGRACACRHGAAARTHG
jgi:hypothetical protein